MSGTVLGSAVYEISVDDSKFNRGLDDADRKSSGLFGKLKGLGTGLATFGLATEGVKQLAGAVGGFLSAAAESEAVAAQTEAVIKSTGGAAGLSADQVGNLATSLSKINPVDDEVIQSAENMLLTFTSIGKDVFPTATQTALDMARTFKTGPEEAAKQLGKALNDPIGGISALSRVGVQFTDQQKEQIKAMVEAGDVAGAQGVILAELARETGGSSVAAGKTFGGQLTILKTQLGNVKETIGMALLPVLTRLGQAAVPFVTKAVDFLSARLPIVMAFFGRLAKQLSGPLHSAFVFIRDGLLTFTQALSGNWTDDSKIRPLHRAIGLIGTVIREQVIPFVRKMVEFFQDKVIPGFHQVMKAIGPIIDALSGGGGLAGVVDRLSKVLGPLADTLIRWAGRTLVMLIDKLGEWAGALIDWIAPQIPPLLVELGKILLSIGSWAKDVALPALAAQLLIWGQALIDWIQPRIGPLLTELGGLLETAGAWFKETGLPLIIAKLGEWGAALIAWVKPQIVPLLAELGALLLSVGDWLITTALPEIGAKLGEWGLAFVEWVGPQIPPLLLELGKLYIELEKWLLTVALPEIGKKLGEWGLAFVAWVGPQIPPLLLELGKLLLALGKWVLETAMPEIAKYLVQWGGKFIGWVADVVTKLPGELLHILEAIGTWIGDNGPDIAAKGLSIGSSIVGGIADGIKDFIGSGLDAALQLLTDHIPGWAKKLLGISSPSKVMMPVGTEVSAGIASGIMSGIPAISAALGSVSGVIGNFTPPAVSGGIGNVPPLTGGVGGNVPPLTGGIGGNVTPAPPSTNPWDNLTSNPVQPTPAPPTIVINPVVVIDDPYGGIGVIGPPNKGYGSYTPHRSRVGNMGGKSVYNFNVGGRTVDKLMTDRFGNIVTRTLA